MDEPERSWHESGADVPRWAVVSLLSGLACILALVVFLVLEAS